MKKMLTLVAAALLAALPLAAAGSVPEPAARQTQDYRLSGFRGLNVSWIYQVELTRGANYSVRVEAPDFVMPYLEVKVQDGKLCLGTRDLPRDVRIKMESGRNAVKAYVTMPQLTDLEMSGATRLTASGQFDAHREFEMKLSGAAKVLKLQVKGTEAEISCSGAAKLELTGDFDKMDLEMSGATGANLSGTVKKADIELGGAAKLAQDGQIGRLELEASGAANYKLTGSLDELELEASGAAKINTSDVPADRARIRLAGAANAIIHVRQELSVSLSGASTCRYRSGTGLRITEQNVSRGSTLAQF
ncbi:MAG: DUF2807 domain-containing protein [Bacteroidales bacterium]|nr:DUF2807 domain-containing protein [Bacteroidales bacterium]